MPSVDEILAGSPLSGLRRVSNGGGDRKVGSVRLAERFDELDDAPAGSFVVLGRIASAEVDGYRLDMALRWAAIHGVAAVAAFSAEQWEPAVTALDITVRAGIALISIPADAELADLITAISAEIIGGAESALGRAGQGFEAVLDAERAGAGPDEMAAAVGRALGVAVEYEPVGARGQRADGTGEPTAGTGEPTADTGERAGGGGERADGGRQAAGATVS